MGKSQRIREVLLGPLTAATLEEKAEAGWRPVAVEWERMAPSAEEGGSTLQEVPYGLRVAADHEHLEENPGEVEIMLAVLEGIVQDQPMSRIADELNRRRYRMRTGEAWTQSAVFELLPRLIDFGPRLFSHEEWVERRRQLRLRAAG